MFTLSKGVQVTLSYFYSALEIISGRMVAFGTVGVGHVWYLPLKDIHDVDLIMAQGDFKVLDRDVYISRLDNALLSGILYWLPTVLGTTSRCRIKFR